MPRFSGLIAGAAAVEQLVVAPREQREQCPHHQALGCFGDALEKTCEPDGYDPGVSSKAAPESIWLCCCPTPYLPCTKAERNEICQAALERQFQDGVHYTQPHMKAAITLAWKEVWEQSAVCQEVLPNPMPESQCGSEIGEQRSIGRAELFCQTVTWQWEQLGDGNEPEFQRNGCPVPSSPRAIDGDSRKGHVLGSSGNSEL
mmetsp:Transcript_39316/g.94538  ORF Transcript_39316/g.94538 Transcript_39316/m.94538 type:complete len:202 (-) Transcript_39316:64-669(-)